MKRSVRFIETRTFMKAAGPVFGPQHVDAVKAKLALNPELGDLIPGTGGARKLRQHGLRGQARVIYYVHLGTDIVLLTCYAKSRQTDLDPDEKKQLRQTIALLKRRAAH